MEIPMDYHLLFLVITFLLLILTIIFLFIEPTVEKTTASVILIIINIIFCIVCAYSFFAIDYYGFDTDGTVVHNAYADMYPLHVIWWGLTYVNIMLIVYCGYLFWKKPWEEHFGMTEDVIWSSGNM
jgi:hypothetical protein